VHAGAAGALHMPPWAEKFWGVNVFAAACMRCAFERLCQPLSS
jgi:hypothetical protein